MLKGYLQREYNVKAIFCLDCDTNLNITSDLALSQRLTCPNCNTTMEIINLDPIEIDWVYDGFETQKSDLYDMDWWSLTDSFNAL